jgi:hypothetical protein
VIQKLLAKQEMLDNTDEGHRLTFSVNKSMVANGKRIMHYTG